MIVWSLKSQKRSVMPVRSSKVEKSLDSPTNTPPVEPDQPSMNVRGERRQAGVDLEDVEALLGGEAHVVEEAAAAPARQAELVIRRIEVCVLLL